MEQQHSPLTNVTSFLPSPADLLLAVPRLLSRAGALGEHIDSVFGKIRSGGSVIAEPTAANLTNATIATTSGKFVQESVAAAASTTTGTQDDMGVFQALKNVGSFFTYISSKWAIATFTIAILLNRTHFYASSRTPLSFDRLHLRLVLYLAPMLLYLYRIQTVLQAIRCQTSPAWSEMQYGASGRQLSTDFSGEGGFLWQASSTLLFWEDLESSCRAVNMLPADAGSTRSAGSLALLWPIFVSLGFGQFVETLACALQGRHPVQEAGMSIFEHSLAFAEAEAVVTKPLTVDSTRFYKPKSVFTPDGSSLTISQSTISQFANVPPEVLLIALISSFSHFTSNFLAITGFRARFRLVSTGIWGLAYMATLAWSVVRFASTLAEPGQQAGILRFPTVCIVGFIPHLLIIAGIVACGVIYLLAFSLTVLSPPPDQPTNLTWRQRFSVAYGNLHANIHLSAITPLTVNWNEDFYTAILKIGFTVLTAASEAVYLNEGTRINVHSMTWLEKKRLQEVLARRRRFRQNMASIPSELRGDALAEGIEVIEKFSADPSNPLLASGYARERKTKGASSPTDAPRGLGQDNGVGLHQRRGRWSLTYQFLRGISMLVMAIQARLVLAVLHKLRITYSPQWLSRLAGPHTNSKAHASASTTATGRHRRLSDPGLMFDEQSSMRHDISFDAEVVAKERLRRSGVYEEDEASEEHLNDYLYDWWKGGGKWGSVDNSGDYVPPQDDDTTSMISFATGMDNDEWSDMEDDGQRTPTRDTWQRSRESTPVPENFLDVSRLSLLLDPKTKQDKEEAKLLARHLQSPGILTRSQYRKFMERDQSSILATSRYRMNGLPGNIHMTPEEEEQLLEEFILDRRNTSGGPGSTAGGTWDSGAEGMGSEGPQCVVCQLSPRTVLVWPCGCLSLCDDCRVGLASKNYTTCVCCRTKVVAYSRLYVP